MNCNSSGYGHSTTLEAVQAHVIDLHNHSQGKAYHTCTQRPTLSCSIVGHHRIVKPALSHALISILYFLPSRSLPSMITPSINGPGKTTLCTIYTPVPYPPNFLRYKKTTCVSLSPFAPSRCPDGLNTVDRYRPYHRWKSYSAVS